jgi:hypothetical protein
LYVLTNSGFLSSFYFYFFIFLILFFKHSYWDFQLDEIWHEKVWKCVYKWETPSSYTQVL